MRVPGITDRNFYDRYYFNMHNCGDEIVMVAHSGVIRTVGWRMALWQCAIKGYAAYPIPARSLWT